MKSWTQIMKDAGFNSNGSPGAKAAFVKYLIKTTYNVDVNIPQTILDLDEQLKKSEQKQLEFQFDDYKIAK